METKLLKLYFRRLRILLISVFMLVALVPLVSFGYIGITQGRQMVQETASSYLTNLSVRSAESINQFMLERVNDIDLLCRILSFSECCFKQHLVQITDDPHRPYMDFFVSTPSGEVIFETGKTNMTPDITAAAGQPGMVWKGAEITEVVELSQNDDSIPVLMLSRHFADPAGNGSLVLTVLVDFRHIDALLRKNNIDATGEVYLIDRKGVFLSGSRFGAKALQSRTPDQKPAMAEAAVSQAVDYRGKAVLQARQSLNPFNWIVVADQDMVEILNRIKVIEKKALRYTTLTGLGLFISHEMARKLGGDLRVVSSEAGGSKRPGTSFTLELPIEE